MNHPIYRDFLMNKTFELIDDMGYHAFKAMITEGSMREHGISREKAEIDFKGFANRIKAFEEIKKHGHILIEAKREDWESQVSEKTLSQMRMRDFKFPFEAGTIILDNELLTFAVDRKDSFFSITLDEGDGIAWVAISLDKTIEENAKLWGKENYSLLFAVISMLLYFSTYSNNKERVSANNIITSKGSKKKKIPKHKINIIKLKQYEGKMQGESGTRGSSDKSWLVRGHWRAQRVGKREENKTKAIWIAPFWKGDGKLEVEKVYKI